MVDDSDGNDLTSIQTVYDNSNGAIYCKFHRSIEGSNDRDKDLVVPHYYIFARGSNSLSDDGSSTATSRLPSGGSVIAVAPRRKRVVSYDRITVIYPNLTMIKAHGSLMMFAFLFLIPLGTILSSFYKIVWPNGGWFFVSLIGNVYPFMPEITEQVSYQFSSSFFFPRRLTCLSKYLRFSVYWQDLLLYLSMLDKASPVQCC